MRLTGKMLRRLISEELDRSLLERLIREAEGDEKADEGGDEGSGDAADDLFGGGDEGGGDDAAADEGGDEGEGGDTSGEDTGGDDAAADEGGGEEGADDAEGDEEKDAEKEEKEKEPVKPTGPAGFEFDEEINQAMMGFEEKALQMGAAKGQVDPIDAIKKEGRVPSLSYLLFEAGEEEVQIDVPTFADDVARLISNYDTLIDMEQAIFTKAKDFLEQKYGAESAEELEDILSRKYQLEFENSDPEASEREVFAANAGTASGTA